MGVTITAAVNNLKLRLKRQVLKMDSKRVEELFGSTQSPTLVLAPMVRAGTLPLRLLALHHGARTTWSEELIAQKLKTCTRVENRELGTIDYVCGRGGRETLVYQTCAFEQGRNILQIGASNPSDAIAAARVVAGDVSGIDLNCGCPQHFSISGGMGAALLSKPCVTAEIISTLRKELPLSVSVSCKIRLLATDATTVDFVQKMVAAGADAITIHARQVSERPRDRARWNELEAIIKEVANVPVIVNGDIFNRTDHNRILNAVPSARGSMVARGAIADVSHAFSGKPQPMTRMMSDYVALGELCSHNFSNSKWFASQVIRYRSEFRLESGATKKVLNESISRAKTIEELSAAFGFTSSGISRAACWENITPENSLEAWQGAIQRALAASEQASQTLPDAQEDADTSKRWKAGQSL